LAGVRWAAPFGARNWDVDAEWSWASQFLYTHHIPVDRYEHYGNSLGSRTGPDSDLWTLALRRQLSRGFGATAFYELERHGEGSLAESHAQRTSDFQNYLSGVHEVRYQPGAAIDYSGLRSASFRLEARAVGLLHANHDPSAETIWNLAISAAARIEL